MEIERKGMEIETEAIRKIFDDTDTSPFPNQSSAWKAAWKLWAKKASKPFVDPQDLRDFFQHNPIIGRYLRLEKMHQLEPIRCFEASDVYSMPDDEQALWHRFELEDPNLPSNEIFVYEHDLGRFFWRSIYMCALLNDLVSKADTHFDENEEMSKEIADKLEKIEENTRKMGESIAALLEMKNHMATKEDVSSAKLWFVLWAVATGVSLVGIFLTLGGLTLATIGIGVRIFLMQ